MIPSIPTTRNGNPKGTITLEQMKMLHACIRTAGQTSEEVNAQCVEKLGKRISGLSVEDAARLIDEYQRPPDDNLMPA